MSVHPSLEKQRGAPGNFVLTAQGLYVGAYVCDHCRMTCEGLYELAKPSTFTYWLCRGCKGAVSVKQEQPAQVADNGGGREVVSIFPATIRCIG